MLIVAGAAVWLVVGMVTAFVWVKYVRKDRDALFSAQEGAATVIVLWPVFMLLTAGAAVLYAATVPFMALGKLIGTLAGKK